jgi:glycosyltransferase involved in cell wall biosynthesis
MKVLLVGNYEFDGSTSMQIWANALLRELLARGVDAELIVPRPVFGRIKPSPTGLGKWLGYIDRFVLFPGRLRAAAAEADVVHICDHGSAMFSNKTGGKPVIVTCHDMLAVRGALGEIAEMRSSLAGRYLQRWVRRGLRRATQVACVSQFTLDDVACILKSSANLCKVLNGLNYPFQPINATEAARRLARLPEIKRPFVLHVGSSHPRKNRDGVMRVFAQAVKLSDLMLVFAGEQLHDDLIQLARRLEIHDRIVQVTKPGVEVVEALYNRAVALIFPSRFEGFGWPAIEAQACGCPVVASDIPPLTESLGCSAARHSLDDETGMADSVVRLATDGAFRSEMRKRGLENVRSRFQTSRMMDDYLSLYRKFALQH